MVRAPLPHLVALLCGVLATLAVGCGDRSHLIPSGRANDLTQQLADIKAKIDQGECDGLDAKVKTFHDDATNLSSSVDARLRKRINEGVQSLQDHAADDCAAAKAAQTQTQTTDTTTTETQTTATQTTETQPQTTTTAPATTTTPPATTTTPPVTTPTTPGTDTGTTTPPDTGGVTPQDEVTP